MLWVLLFLFLILGSVRMENDFCSSKEKRSTVVPREDGLINKNNAELKSFGDGEWKVHVIVIPSNVAVRDFSVAGLPCTSQEGKLETTQWLASHNNCTVAAMNGSPFGPHAACIGKAISKNHALCNDCTNEHIVSLALTKQNNWVIGHGLTEYSNYQQLIPGFNNHAWIVQNGEICVSHDDNAMVVAPRSIVALTDEGTMIWMVVDGCEYCLLESNGGMTLRDAAKWLHQHFPNVKHAMNLDGGGSSTLLYQSKVVNHPTAYDVLPIQAQRPISNILCLSQNIYQ